jgi:hypothetical protein
MLNILKLKTKNEKPLVINNEKYIDLVGYARHNPPANKEWSNSIYSFNKNTPKLLPVADKVIIKLIRSYFNLYSRKLERKIRSARIRKWMRRLSTTRILVSKGELKHHSADKVIVTLYIYNRQAKYYKKKMTKLFNKIMYISLRIKLEAAKKIFKKKIKLLNKKGLDLMSRIKYDKNLLLKTLKWNENNLITYEKDYYKSFIKKSLRKERIYIYLKEIMSLNKFKFKNTYLLPLKILIQKIYNKRVEFNLVILKNFHLNSDIFTQILALKLRNRKNRILRVLKTSLRKIKLPSQKKLIYLDEYNYKNNIVQYLNKDLFFNNVNLNVTAINEPTDNLDKTLKTFYSKNKSLNLEDTVLNSIKHKAVSGIRLEASGRLTRRITAAKSIYKFKYLGNLRNIDSSFLNRSSVILRGNLRSNLQFSKIKSKTKIGSFGLKGWVSSP